MGPSGTGKTTLLRMITGQLRAGQGSVRIADGDGMVDIGSLDRKGIYRLRRRMGMLFQNSALLTDLTVFENVAFPLRENTNLPDRLVRTVVLMKLEAVGLRGAANLMPAELSGGMGRRVAMARALVLDPELLLYDEPFSGLDPISLGVILRLIRETNDVLGLTSIVVSHDVDEIALLADYCHVIAEGRVIASGTPAELAGSDSALVRQFMTGAADGPVPFHFPAGDFASDLSAD
jgi:phospholipid/cholesterol/gamma-HCH transport system ATP-binding protein